MNFGFLERSMAPSARFYINGISGLGTNCSVRSHAVLSPSANNLLVGGIGSNDPVRHYVTRAGPKNNSRIVCYNGRWVAKIEVPQKLMGLLIGARGATLRQIEESTGCRLTIPQRGQELPVEVKSMIGEENVQRCLDQIKEIVGQGKSFSSFTHFTSFPCNQPDIMTSFNIFRNRIMSSERFSPSIKDESLFTKSERLHLTISMMSLLDEAKQRKAKEVLEVAATEIRATLSGASLMAEIWGVSIMNDDPHSAHVLYANVSGEGPQVAADIVYKQMVTAGLSPKPREEASTAEHPVKMHMTLANSRYKAQKFKLKRESFDASAVLEDFHDYYFGKVLMNRVSICCLQSSSPHGFYEELGSTTLM